MKPTEIHGPNGELIFLPQSPAEIVRATHCYEALLKALKRLHYYGHRHCESDLCYAKLAIDKAEVPL